MVRAFDAPTLLVTNIGELVTPVGAGPHKGSAQARLWRLPDAAVAVREGRIVWVGPRAEWQGEVAREVDAAGRVVLPGLVDPHTHAVWAGDRLDDFEARARGISYEEILAAGGGIYHTVRQTTQADVGALVALALPRMRRLLRSGATTVEVKSGYGLAPAAELKLLRAIRRLCQEAEADIVPTLLVHVPPPEGRAAYVEEVVRSLLPAVAREGLAVAVDIFVEREAFTVAEAERVLRAAQEHGLAVKLHADQFHALGGVELGVRLGALSVDHLEASGPPQIAALAKSRTVGVLLPGVSLHLGIPPAPGRALVDAGAAVAVGTDLNPGSSPLFSAQLALALAVRLNGLSPAEALVAATANAAAALGLADRGRVEPGCRADLLVLDSHDWRDLAYTLGADDLIARVFVAGKQVHPQEGEP